MRQIWLLWACSGLLALWPENAREDLLSDKLTACEDVSSPKCSEIYAFSQSFPQHSRGCLPGTDVCSGCVRSRSSLGAGVCKEYVDILYTYVFETLQK